MRRGHLYSSRSALGSGFVGTGPEEEGTILLLSDV